MEPARALRSGLVPVYQEHHPIRSTHSLVAPEEAVVRQLTIGWIGARASFETAAAQLLRMHARPKCSQFPDSSFARTTISFGLNLSSLKGAVVTEFDDRAWMRQAKHRQRL